MTALDVVLATRSSALSPVARLLLIQMAAHAHGTEGSCTAAVPTLAEEIGASARTTQRAMAELLTAGWLCRSKDATSRHPAHYRVTPPGGVTNLHPRGDTRGDKSADDQREERDVRLSGDKSAPHPEPGAPYRVVGAAEPEPGELPMEELARLLAMQRNNGEPLYPEPHLNDRSATILQRKAREGWTVEEFEELFALAQAADRSFLVWWSLLGPKYLSLQGRAQELVARLRAERHARETAHIDPWAGKRPRYQADEDDVPVLKAAK